MSWKKAAGLGALLAACSGCGSNLKMRVGDPLEVKRGYAIDLTRFRQDKKEVERSDVLQRLGNRRDTAGAISSARTFETVSTLVQVPAFVLLLLAAAPEEELKMSSGTRTGLLASGLGVLALDVTLYFVTESKYVGAVEVYNASLPAAARAEPTAASGKPSKVAQGFPESVSGYTFGAQIGTAEAVCRSRAQEWSLSGSEAACKRTAQSSAGALDVRLRFDLGVLSAVTVLYQARPELLNRDYAQLAAALRERNGAPRVDPPLSASCSQSLPACLSAHEQVKAIVWSWARGSLELEPVWHDDQARLELRYLTNDQLTP